MKGQSVFDQPLVAFDKSETSIEMLKIIDRFRPTFSKMTILNVHNPRKTYIPYQLSGLSIYNYLIQRYPLNQNPDIAIESKAIGQKNTNMIILQTFVAKSSSILFLGFVGSKGRKVRSKDLSSRLRQFIYQSRLNLAIIKCEDRNTNHVLFLFDGSDTSVQGLQTVITLCNKIKAQLTVLHTYNADLKKHSKHIRIQLKELQEHHHAKFNIVIEEIPLITALQEKAASFDWVILNKNGYRGSINKARFVGSNASQVVQSIEANLILLN